jgi:CoA-ligase
MSATTGPSAHPVMEPAYFRWLQLAIGIVCMAMIANLQYGWMLFVDPIDAKFHWGRAAIQLAFTFFVVTEGADFIAMLELCLADPETKSIVMIGGSSEEDAAQFIKDEAKRGRKKPMVGFFAGRTAPPGRRGPRRCDHLRRKGRCRIQDRRDGSRRHSRFCFAGTSWKDPDRRAERVTVSMNDAVPGQSSWRTA